MSRVSPTGPRNAKIAIVGEAPGKTEVIHGEPFTGASGKLLNSLLNDAGIIRKDCYITNVLKTRPPGNDFSIFYKDKSKKEPTDDLLKHRQTVVSEIQKVRPNVTILLGTEALKAFGGDNRSSITNWRGSILYRDDVGKMIPTYHPAYVLRMYHHAVILKMDLQKARKESLFPEYKKTKRNGIISPSYDQVMDCLEGIKDGDTIAFDVETTGDYIRCLGLAWSSTEALCIPFLSRKPQDTFVPISFHGTPMFSHWSAEEEYSILKKVNEVMRREKVRKVAQNFPFDGLKMESNFGIQVRGLHLDTMVGFHRCFSELPKSLDFLTSIYTDVGYYADYDSSDDTSTWIYNTLDCMVTHEVSGKIESDMKEFGIWEYYKNHLEPALYALTRAQNYGPRVNVKLFNQMRMSREAELEVINKRTSETFNRDINLGSPKQVSEYLYHDLCLPVQRHKKTKKPTTDEKAVEKLRQKYPEYSDQINTLLRFRKVKKQLSSFFSAKLKDGRFLTSYNLAGTVNGRLSSEATLEGYGGNIQQIEKSELRKCICASKDHYLIKVDLAQAEFRFVVWDARIHRLIQKYKNEPDFDVHTWNAAHNIFHIPEEDVTSKQRSVSKGGVHGGNYGLGPGTAAAMYNITFAEAKKSINGYKAGMPELQKWWKMLEDEVKHKRILTTPLGNRRTFLGRLDNNTFRSAYSFRPQSHICDVILRAFALGTLLLKPYKARPLIQMHDEIVYECPKGALHEVVPIIKNTMEYPTYFKENAYYEAIEEPLVIPAEIEYGDNWYEVEEYNG